MPQHWSRAARAGGRGGSRQEFEAFEEQQLAKAPAWQRRCLRGRAEGRLARLAGGSSCEQAAALEEVKLTLTSALLALT